MSHLTNSLPSNMSSKTDNDTTENLIQECLKMGISTTADDEVLRLRLKKRELEDSQDGFKKKIDGFDNESAMPGTKDNIRKEMFITYRQHEKHLKKEFADMETRWEKYAEEQKTSDKEYANLLLEQLHSLRDNLRITHPEKVLYKKGEKEKTVEREDASDHGDHQNDEDNQEHSDKENIGGLNGSITGSNTGSKRLEPLAPGPGGNTRQYEYPEVSIHNTCTSKVSILTKPSPREEKQLVE